MKGTRPLDNQEIRLVSACFEGKFEARQSGAFYARGFPLAGGLVSC